MVSFTSVTKPDILKRGNPWAESARKVTIGTGVICWQYSAAVRRVQERNGDAPTFRAQPRTWGQRIPRTPLVCFVNADGVALFYLEIKIERRTEHYFDAKTRQRIDEQLRPFLKPDPVELVTLRDYKLASIAELTLNGHRYCVLPAINQLRKFFPPDPAASAAAVPRRKTSQRTLFAKGRK